MDVATHELSIAFGALRTTGEMELKLHTTGLPSTQSLGLQSASVSAASSDHGRKLSQSSSVWSLINKDGSEMSSATDISSSLAESDYEPSPSEEKEVYGPTVDLRSDLGNRVFTNQATSVPNWRSPFAVLDPLSVPMDEASTIILLDGDSQAVLSAARSRTSSSSLFVDACTEQNIGSDVVEFALQIQASEEDGIGFSAEKGPVIPYRDRLDSSSSDRTSGPHPETEYVQDVRAEAESSSVPIQASRMPLCSDHSEDQSHLRSIPSSPRRQSLQHKESAMTIQGSRTSLEASTGEGQNDSNIDQRDRPDTSDYDAGEITANADSDVAGDSSRQGSAESGVTCFDIYLASEQTQEHPEASVQAYNSGQSKSLPPKAPSRAPPLPPIARRTKSRRASTSRYVVVNPSPGDEDSEDELYSTSRPASMTLPNEPVINALEPPHVQKTSTKVPEVRIDGSACDQDAREPAAQEALVATGAPPTRAFGSKRMAGLPPVQPKPGLPPWKGGEKFASSSNSQAPPKEMEHESTYTMSEDQSRSPVVPRRPSRYSNKGKERSVSCSILTGTPMNLASSATDHLADNSDLEVDTRSRLLPSKPEFRHRKSADEVLDVRPVLPSAAELPSRPRSQSERSSTQGRPTNGPLQPKPGVVEFYASREPDLDGIDLDAERVRLIVDHFNNCWWDEAEAYLLGHLERLIEKDEFAIARRIRHLLGVCASFKGDILRSISFFLAALQTPIRDISQLDAGDCAAAYWLGDAYAMRNERNEALLAYSIAERAPMFMDPVQPYLQACVNAEQESCLLGLSKAEFGLRWAREALNSSRSKNATILDPHVITSAAANMCLENEPRRFQSYHQRPFHLGGDESRANALYNLSMGLPIPSRSNFHSLKINEDMLTHHSAPWPLAYDPLFAMLNVARGRLLAYECDLLTVFSTNAQAKIPKGGPVGISRMDCFTCNDLDWLIRAIRSCLETLEIEWSEVANVEGAWFVCRYKMVKKRVATAHYFSIALFKQSWRSGYGVDICPDGFSSSRLIETNFEHEKGVSLAEPKRIKMLIRDFLDQAAKQRPKAKQKGASPTTFELDAGLAGARSVSQTTTEHTNTPPPVPPRPHAKP